MLTPPPDQGMLASRASAIQIARHTAKNVVESLVSNVSESGGHDETFVCNVRIRLRMSPKSGGALFRLVTLYTPIDTCGSGGTRVALEEAETWLFQHRLDCTEGLAKSRQMERRRHSRS